MRNLLRNIEYVQEMTMRLLNPKIVIARASHIAHIAELLAKAKKAFATA